MSKSKEVNNPCPYFIEIRDEEGQRGDELAIPNDNGKGGVSPQNVRDNGMKLGKVEKYEIRAESIDGDILRIGNYKYTPVSKGKKSQYIVREIDGQVQVLRVGSKSASISKKEEVNITEKETKEDNSR